MNWDDIISEFFKAIMFLLIGACTGDRIINQDKENILDRAKELNLMEYDYKSEKHILKDSIVINKDQFQRILWGEK